MTTVCFYCGATLAADLPDAHPNSAGRDHIFPRTALRALAGLVAFSDEWRARNRVPCCQRCNNVKGNRHPVDWLATLLGDGADRLRARLVELGVPSREIDARLAELSARTCRGVPRQPIDVAGSKLPDGVAS